MKTYLFFAVAVSATVLILSLVIYFSIDSDQDSVATKTTAKEFKIEDQTLDGKKMKLTTRVEKIDKSKDAIIRGGDTVRVVTTLENNSDAQSRFLTVKSGAKKEDFFAARNLMGATGFKEDGNEITFANVVLRNGQKQEISFEAIAIANDSTRDVSIKPILKNKEGEEILTGENSRYEFIKSVDQILKPINN